MKDWKETIREVMLKQINPLHARRHELEPNETSRLASLRNALEQFEKVVCDHRWQNKTLEDSTVVDYCDKCKATKSQPSSDNYQATKNPD